MIIQRKIFLFNIAIQHSNTVRGVQQFLENDLDSIRNKISLKFNDLDSFHNLFRKKVYQDYSAAKTAKKTSQRLQNADCRSVCAIY